MKKTYISPRIVSLVIEEEQHLMAGSYDPRNKISVNTEEYVDPNDNNWVYHKEYGAWTYGD